MQDQTLCGRGRGGDKGNRRHEKLSQTRQDTTTRAKTNTTTTNTTKTNRSRSNGREEKFIKSLKTEFKKTTRLI